MRRTHRRTQARAQTLPPPRRSQGAYVDTLAQVFEHVAALQVPREAFERYAKRKYGGGWNLNTSGVRRVLKDLRAFEGNGASLLATVNAETDVVQ